MIDWENQTSTSASGTAGLQVISQHAMAVSSRWIVRQYIIYIYMYICYTII